TMMEREWALTEQDWSEHLKLHWAGCYFDECPGHADMKRYGRWNPKPPKWMKQEIRERRAKAEEMRNKRFEEYEKEKQRKEQEEAARSAATRTNNNRSEICVGLRIHGQIAKCMVDTGTVHCTLISNRFVEQYHLPVKKLARPVNIDLTVKGSRSGVNTSTTVEVEAGWDSFEHEFYIASLSQFDAIIGIDVLDRMEAMI